MSKNKKNNTKALVIVVVIVILFAASLGGLYYYLTKQHNEEIVALTTTYTEKIQGLETRINSSTKTVYMPLVEVQYGTEVTEDQVEEMSIISDVDTEQYATLDEIRQNPKALINLLPGQPIYKSDLINCTEELDKLQEVEISYVKLNSNLLTDDTVDIRIRFDNGEDYIVIAKKQMRNLNLAAADFFMWLTEEEIMKLSSACVDAYVNGATIYMTRYFAPSVQSDSYANYQPTIEVQNLIANDLLKGKEGNIVDLAQKFMTKQARAEMDARLSAFRETNGLGGRAEQFIGSASGVTSSGGRTLQYSDDTSSEETDSTGAETSETETTDTETTDTDE